MVKMVVNGKEINAPEGKNLLTFLRGRGEHIPGMCHMPVLDPYGSCRLCLVEADGKVTTSCTLKTMEGLKVETLTDRIIEMRRNALELMLSDHSGDCIGPCQDGCPAHSDVQGYLALIAMGKYHEAVKLMKEKYILPAVLGRICPAFCEDECRRNLVDEPVAIRQVKRFAADYDLKNGSWMPDIPPSSGKKIAIVGGGPSGLACAYYLRTMGHGIKIFESMPEPGGMMRYGIPEYRLPKNVLGEDVATVINTGIEIESNCTVGEDVSLDALRNEYDAVFLGIGAWKSREIKIEGEKLDGVIHGINFLRRVNIGKEPNIGKKVIVVGGGNTAIDVARTTLRLGSEVTVAYRRSRNEMPANEEEVREAEEEGVRFLFLTNIVKVHGKEKVENAELMKMELGEPDESGRRRPVPIKDSNFITGTDNVILAIGQYCDEKILEGLDVKSMKGKVVVDDVTLQTNLDNVFAGGDLIMGPSTVIESVATGRKAAIMMDLYMKGKLGKVKEILLEPSKHLAELSKDEEVYNVLFDLRPYNHWKTVAEKDYKDAKRIPRIKKRVVSASDRIKNFSEVEKTISEEEVLEETRRCMSCGCMKIFNCKLREYSTLYDAKQDAFIGEKSNFKIDEWHPHIVLDNNKCVLCGRCVNLTQEITGEGMVDYVSRGFRTKISPPYGFSLGDMKGHFIGDMKGHFIGDMKGHFIGDMKGHFIGDMKGHFIGDMIDVCPTGAIIEKLPFVKPGPWKTESIPTVCNGCGLGCEMNIEVYDDEMLVRASSKLPSWNNGHLCDKGRFERLWESKTEKVMIDKNGPKEITFNEAVKIIKEHMDDMAVILTPEVTQEEAQYFKNLAAKHRFKIGALVERGVSTAKYVDLLNSRRVLMEANLERHPYLEVLLKQIKNSGAQIVKEHYDFAILDAPAEPLAVPTLILHKGINEAGLLSLGLKSIPKAESYLVVGNLKEKLDGFTIVLGKSEYADVTLPYPAWAEKDGTIINDFNMELKVNSAREGRVNVEEMLSLIWGDGKNAAKAIDKYIKTGKWEG